MQFNQPNQCEAYQLASQALCSALPLYSRFDSTRHEGQNIMKFRTESGNNNTDKQELAKPDNEEVNPEAYEQEEDESEESESKEQAGVAHLVHGWPQQGQARLKVSFTFSHLSQTLVTLICRGFSSLGTYRIQAQAWQQLVHITTSPNRLQLRLRRCFGPSFQKNMRSMKRPSMLECGCSVTPVHILVVPLFTSCKDACTKIDMTLGHPPPLASAVTPVERCYFLNLGPNFRELSLLY